MDISITVTNRDNKIKKIIAPTDMNLNLMEILKVYEYPIEGTCGGMALCASCHIFVNSKHDLPAISLSEKAILDDNWDAQPNSRLACQIPISKKIDLINITLAPEI
jgi:2Fe-2S ferredoxin